MMRLASSSVVLLLALGSQMVACKQVTTVSSDSPIQISAQPPAPPLAELPTVPQPPPPRRVILEGDLLTLDEPLTFDDEGKLAAEHEDIIAEIAKWLAENSDVVELTVEVQSVGTGSKRTLKKRSKALATQIVDALVGEGIEAERLLAGAVGASPDGARNVTLRVRKTEAAVGFEIEE